MTICNLCGEDVPEDDKGIGQTLKFVHECMHTEEMRRLGMVPQQYIAFCTTRMTNILTT